jgi:hypothetical protein
LSASERGRVTVGLTPAGAEALAKVMSTNWFAEEKDAYKVGIAIALRAEINVDQPLGGATTKFNIGTLDPDQKVVALIQTFLGSEAGDPVVLAERLAEQGLLVLAAKLVDQEEKLSDVLGVGSEDSSDAEG